MTNPYTGCADSFFLGDASTPLYSGNRRKKEINVPTERRIMVRPNLANQAFEDLCHVCFAAGECTCSDEQFYADRATFLSKEMK